MANKFQFSSGLIQQMLSIMFAATASATMFGNTSGSANNRMFIFKGAMPTDAEINALAGTAFITARDSDILLDVSYYGTYDTVSLNVAKLKNTAFVNAVRSGQATFFILFTNAGSNSAAAIGNAIVGKITDSAGDGDMKLPDVNIVAGKQYRIAPLAFALPYQYTY